MTRINLVPPEELMDQHLFSEWREIKMVPRSLARSLQARGLRGVLGMVPGEFCLNKGHVSFFYDKGHYLVRRYRELSLELERRGVHEYDKGAVLDKMRIYDNLPLAFVKDYEPTPEALELIRERIAARVAARPGWYRMRGVPQ